MDKEHIGLIIMIVLLMIGLELFTEFKITSIIFAGIFVIGVIIYGDRVHNNSIKKIH